MTTGTLEDLYPTVDTEAATAHLDQLHTGGTGYISLVAMRGRRVSHGFSPIHTLAERVPIREGQDALQEVVNERFDLYTACATFSEIPERGRGRVTDVSTIPGVWADLDVKPNLEGHFHSEQEIMNYLDQFPKPTLLINSGSGGRHAYWLVHPETRHVLDHSSGSNLLVMWRDFLLSKAGGLEIDNVQDTTRILRLAGSVRWPKIGETRPPALVSLEIGDGPRYYIDFLRIEATEAHEAAITERQARRQAMAAERHRNEELEARYGRRAIDQFNQDMANFNQYTDWATLLEPDGWTLFTDRGDCRYWTRPGKDVRDGKSAATDYLDERGHQSHLMTIYSEDAGLADIVETVTPAGRRVCSKWHYAKIRKFHQDETELLRYAAHNRRVA